MPELPEVEGARRLVKRNCVGKRVTKAIIADDDSE
jgi:formamidopyrimidine-DNA glycosylase